MIFRHSIQILCWMLIVNSTVKNVRAISFDDIFEYFLDALDDSDESTDELADSNLNVTCKNCSVSVECHNCTHSYKDTESTVPMQTSTQITQQVTSSSSLPTPTIPAPEIVSSSRPPSQSTATVSQSVPTTITAPVPSTPTASTNPGTSSTQADSTKSLDDGNQITDDGANVTTDSESSASDGVTGGNE